MGTKYGSGVSVSGYNANPPSDDGSTTESNKVKWSTHKTKLTDPIKTAIESVNTALVTALDSSARAVTASDTAAASDHDKTIQVTSASVVITLSDAATMAAGYKVTIANQSTGTISVALATSTNTIDTVTNAVPVLSAKEVREYIVNAAATGYVTKNGHQIPFIDSNPVIVGSADSTKKVRFEVDGLTTGTTRVVTVPDKNGTMAMTSDITSSVVRSYLAGCGLSNNGSDATNDIDIAAGVCADSTNAVNITVAAMTKQLDASWAAGTNQGMRYSGAVIANTTYHIWAVAKADGTQDIYATPNASASTASAALTLLQAESGGANYAYARRIGSILRESGAIVAFTQYGDTFLRNTPTLDVNSSATGDATVTLATPTGVVMEAIMRVYHLGGDDSRRRLLYSLATSGGTPSASAAPLFTLAQGQNVDGLRVFTNTSAQIGSTMDAGVTTGAFALRISTTGWVDRRGRDS